MNHKNLKNEIEDGEILSREDEKVRALLGSLKRVAAPADFDFRLKAKIARARPNDYRPAQFLPVLRYVLPLGLVLFVSALAVLNGVYFTDGKSAQPIAENRFENSSAANTSDTAAKIASNSVESVQIAPKEPEILTAFNQPKVEDKRKQTAANPPLDVASRINGKTKAKTSLDKNSDENTIYSRTSAFSLANAITPPGINPNKTVQTSPNINGAKPLTVREVLSQLGIEAVYAGENWTVKSVGQNTLAERSGIKTGDAVEAIDGEKLTDKPLKHITVEGKKLTIARGVEKIEIFLGSKSN